MRNSVNFSSILNSIALFSIGGICLGYVFGGSNFAELNIKFPFLDFPIFIGEWLIGWCLVLLMLKMNGRSFKIQKGSAVIILYFLFVALKALTGYQDGGPFAFRNAALFYYPICAVIAYHFFDQKLILRYKYLIIPLIFSVFLIRSFYIYFLLTCFVLAVVLIQAVRSGSVKKGFWVLLFVLTPYAFFFRTARMMIVAHMIFAVYIIIIGFNYLNMAAYKKWASVIVSVILMVFFTFSFCRGHTFISIFNFPKLQKVFNDFDQKIEEKKSTFVFQERDVSAIYNPNSNRLENKDLSDYDQENKDDPQSIEYKKELKRITEVEVNNAVFRLFVWRDMWDEFKEQWPVFGFSFGKPFRSISLESLGWAAAEWERDGWVAPHNSFFHIIYRSGIIGVLFIAGILILLFRMTLGFIHIRSWNGILLCGVLLSWFVAANFLLTLELPYTAIPIWSLYGMTFAYYQSKINPEQVLNGLEK